MEFIYSYGNIFIISITLLSGHGSWLIAGYNTMKKEDKAKYDVRKLCRITGIGISFITILLLITCLFNKQLPAEFAYVLITLIIIDVVFIIVVGNLTSRK